MAVLVWHYQSSNQGLRQQFPSIQKLEKCDAYLDLIDTLISVPKAPPAMQEVQMAARSSS